MKNVLIGFLLLTTASPVLAQTNNGSYGSEENQIKGFTCFCGNAPHTYRAILNTRKKAHKECRKMAKAWGERCWLQLGIHGKTGDEAVLEYMRYIFW